MKNPKLGAVLYALYAVFLLFAGLLAAVTVLNRVYSESWRSFYANVLSGFTDCPDIFPIYRAAFCVILILTGAILLDRFLRYRCGFFWALRVRLGRLRFTLGGLEPAGKKKQVRFRAAALLLAVLSCVLCGSMALKDLTRRNLWPGDTWVVHALGALGNFTYTDSREAFEYWYARGARTFEADMQRTTDGHVVLAHEFYPMSFQEFMSGTALGHTFDGGAATVETPYTTMSLTDLFLLMKERPDVWIITDSKYTDPQDIEWEFRYIVDAAREAGAEETLDRLVVQIYNEQMYDIVREIYPFKSYIFTLYLRWDGLRRDGDSISDFADICKWCRANDIDALCMYADIYLLMDEVRSVAQRYGLDVYVHTINDADYARNDLAMGARGVYTDSLDRATLGA